jgi:hypothetical protein
VDLELAAVARPGIYMPYGQRAGEFLEDLRAQAVGRHAQRLVGLGRRLGLDAGYQDLFQQLIHKFPP